MLQKHILEELQEYLDQHLLITLCEKSAPYMEDSILESISPIELESFINKKRKPTLQKVLFQFIDKKSVTDAEIYKKAGIDRRHFSKIRSNPNYRPGKNTVIALALALELTKKETEKLLSSAGYTLSESETSDLIIQFCLEKKIYDILQVNFALDQFNLKPLTGIL
jgi:hypothetical protein